jgi:hypothetical protein
MATRFLTPMTAVEIAWARTGQFSSSPHSEQMGHQANARLKKIEEDASKEPRDCDYVQQVVSAMDATHRTLDTIYKGRELNFKENEKLRQSSLDSIQDVVQFGTRAKDFVRSLPGLAIGSAGGVTLLNALYPGDSIPDYVTWAAGVGAAALGYLVFQAAMLLSRRWKEQNYIREDYDRGLYYQQYVKRTEVALRGLYDEACAAHRRAFDEDVCGDDGTELNTYLDALQPTFCRYVHEHMRRGVVRCKHWPMCETGGPPESNRDACDWWPKGVS